MIILLKYVKGFELKNLSKFAAFDMRWVWPYEESNHGSSDLKDLSFSIQTLSHTVNILYPSSTSLGFL